MSNQEMNSVKRWLVALITPLILALLLQIGAMIWWASSITQQTRNHAETLERHEQVLWVLASERRAIDSQRRQQ